MQEEYKGFTINIEQDDMPENPREWDNLGTMVCFHSRYNLGDKHTYDSVEAFIEDRKKTDILLPLYLYDHSGLTMKTASFNDIWDSGQVGFIYTSKEKVLENFIKKELTPALIKKAKEVLKCEVEIYTQFLEGDVWGYTIEGLDDSCWGFYGQESALEEAKSIIDYHIKAKQEKKIARTKKLIQSHVPLIYR